MNHEYSPQIQEFAPAIVHAVGNMRIVLRNESGRKIEDPQTVSLEGGSLTFGYEDESFEWETPRLLVDVQAEGSTTRGIFAIDSRRKDFEDEPVLTVKKFDQQLRSTRDAYPSELEDLARLVSSIDNNYVERVLEQRRTESKRTGFGSKVAALFSRNR